jgi:hypothetical protein
VDKEPSIVFTNVPTLACEELAEMVRSQGTEEHLQTSTPPKGAPGSHGELATATIAIAAAKIVLPLVVMWLLKKAPPKPRKETFEIRYPDGRVVTHTVEYSSRTKAGELLQMLKRALGMADGST